MTEFPDVMIIKQISYTHFQIFHGGQWVDIKMGKYGCCDFGFSCLAQNIPVLKAIHGSNVIKKRVLGESDGMQQKPTAQKD